jgi:hypothetical protein
MPLTNLPDLRQNKMEDFGLSRRRAQVSGAVRVKRCVRPRLHRAAGGAGRQHQDPLRRQRHARHVRVCGFHLLIALQSRRRSCRERWAKRTSRCRSSSIPPAVRDFLYLKCGSDFERSASDIARRQDSSEHAGGAECDVQVASSHDIYITVHL